VHDLYNKERFCPNGCLKGHDDDPGTIDKPVLQLQPLQRSIGKRGVHLCPPSKMGVCTNRTTSHIDDIGTNIYPRDQIRPDIHTSTFAILTSIIFLQTRSSLITCAAQNRFGGCIYIDSVDLFLVCLERKAINIVVVYVL
jgi:hypothetical protein